MLEKTGAGLGSALRLFFKFFCGEKDKKVMFSHCNYLTILLMIGLFAIKFV